MCKIKEGKNDLHRKKKQSLATDGEVFPGTGCSNVG